jgi:hypothetical protein
MAEQVIFPILVFYLLMAVTLVHQVMVPQAEAAVAPADMLVLAD